MTPLVCKYCPRRAWLGNPKITRVYSTKTTTIFGCLCDECKCAYCKSHFYLQVIKSPTEITVRPICQGCSDKMNSWSIIRHVIDKTKQWLCQLSQNPKKLPREILRHSFSAASVAVGAISTRLRAMCRNWSIFANAVEQ